VDCRLLVSRLVQEVGLVLEQLEAAQALAEALELVVVEQEEAED
jgi:hypothetical protein